MIYYVNEDLWISFSMTSFGKYFFRSFDLASLLSFTFEKARDEIKQFFKFQAIQDNKWTGKDNYNGANRCFWTSDIIKTRFSGYEEILVPY